MTSRSYLPHVIQIYRIGIIQVFESSSVQSLFKVSEPIIHSHSKAVFIINSINYFNPLFLIRISSKVTKIPVPRLCPTPSKDLVRGNRTPCYMFTSYRWFAEVPRFHLSTSAAHSLVSWHGGFRAVDNRVPPPPHTHTRNAPLPGGLTSQGVLPLIHSGFGFSHCIMTFYHPYI